MVRQQPINVQQVPHEFSEGHNLYASVFISETFSGDWGATAHPKLSPVGKFWHKGRKGSFTLNWSSENLVGWADHSCIWVHFEVQFIYADMCTVWHYFSTCVVQYENSKLSKICSCLSENCNFLPSNFFNPQRRWCTYNFGMWFYSCNIRFYVYLFESRVKYTWSEVGIIFYRSLTTCS